jgi:large subunit ribosomal protein L6
VPDGVEVKINGNLVSVKGPKGELEQEIFRNLTVEQEDGQIMVKRPNNARQNRAQHGLARSLIANMVQGVKDGHSKELEIHGVGYRAQVQGKALQLSVGYSHPILIQAPDQIDFEVSGDERSRVVIIKVSGIDKQVVGQIAADIRKTRKPDPYKGKGVRYRGEYVRLKPGKRAQA